MLGKINLSGGVDINGIINEYKVNAGQTIKAGDFVEFVNNLGTDTQLQNLVINELKAVALAENKVFITYTSDSDYTTYLYGVICSINNNTITYSTPTLLASNISNIKSIVLIEENKVMIIYDSYGVICTINNTNITLGTAVNISSGSLSSSVLVDDNKVLVTYTNNSKLYGVICTINETTITTGTPTELVSNNNLQTKVESIALQTNKIFISYRIYENSKNDMYGFICTINNSIITVGISIKINSVDNQGVGFSLAKITNNKIFIAHGNSSLYGIVCTINENTITKGTDTLLSYIDYSGIVISTLLITNNKVAILHSQSSDYYLYQMLCNITDTNIIIEKDEILNNAKNTGSIISTVLINTNAILIVHSSYINNYSDYYLYSVVEELYKLQKVRTGINGIAKEDGTAGDIIEIYEPN